MSGYNSILPLPPFMRKNAVQREMERKHHERMVMFQRIFEKHSKSKKNSRAEDQQVCKHPHLDLKHDANKHAYYHLPPLNCTGKSLFSLSDGVVKLNRSVLEGKELGKCVYLGIERVTDDYFTYTESLEKNVDPYDIILEQDFIRIQCFLKSSETESKEKVEISNHEKSVISFRRRLLRNLPGEDNPGELVFVPDHIPHSKNTTNFISNYNHSSNSYHSNNSYNSNNSYHSNNNITLNSDYKHSYHINNKSEDSVKIHGNDYGDSEHSFHSNSHEVENAHPHNDYGDYGYNYDVWNQRNQVFGVESSECDFDQFLLHVHPKASVFDRISKTKPGKFSTKMNVLFFGLDSMSQLSFRRKLPKTMKYLQELKSVTLNGYNIVGDATTAALIPMLTGKTEVELPEVRKSEMESEMVDVYPLIWKKFQDDGYVTMFAEDEPTIGAFNLRLTGFQEQPTDHYMRQFWLAIWESMLRSNSPRYCTGNTPHHTFMLDYLKDFFVKYHNVSKFAFGFQSELSHWNNNPVEYIDEELTEFLRFLNVKGFLDNTLLILMGDHGARYSTVRNTVQGKLEERLPMMTFRFPPWFEDKFPKAIENLRKNANRLSTPFDVHETLLDVLDYSRIDVQSQPGDKSMSLLKEVPLNRTCKSAGIDTHWCACLTQVRIPSNDKFAQISAKALVSFMNNYTQKQRHYCAVLKLKEVLTAMLVIPNEQVLRYKSSQDDDQRIANFTSDINMDKAHYQITIETLPNKGIYEATVEVDFRNETYRYNVTPEISRIDRYGDQPKCVQDKYPDLRKYCFCHPVSSNGTQDGGQDDVVEAKHKPGNKSRNKAGNPHGLRLKTG
ncbi:hypothetical protein SNE40_000052 [Patella caerulea]